MKKGTARVAGLRDRALRKCVEESAQKQGAPEKLGSYAGGNANLRHQRTLIKSANTRGGKFPWRRWGGGVAGD